MLVYRISQTRYADDLTGEGARLFGGRWNLPMVPCLYACESRALAMLEYSANVNVYEIRRALSFITIEIDEKVIVEVPIRDLPGNWRSFPIAQNVQEFGTRLLVEEKAPILKIPSVIIEDEFNYLINPGCSSGVKIIGIKDFSYDLRVKTK